MMNSMILGFVRVFVERQVIKFGKALDWELVKKDLVFRISQLVPNQFFDEAAAFIVGVLIDLMKAYFDSKPLPEVLGGDLLSKSLDSAFADAQNNLLRTIAYKAAAK